MTHNELISEVCKRTTQVNAAEAAQVIKALKDILRELPPAELLKTIAELVSGE